MLKFQSILLSLILLIFSSLTLAADEATDSTPTEQTSSGSEQIVEQDNMIRQSQPIEGFQPLAVAGQEIDATFLEETLGERHGAIVLLHDQGEALESSGVITPLRHQLLQYGWSTLTLKLDYPSTANILLATNSDAETDVSTASPSTSATKEEATAASETSSSDTAQPENIDDDKKDQPAVLPPISNKQRIEAAIEFLKAKDVKRLIFLGHGDGGLIAIDEAATNPTLIAAVILVGTPALENDEEFKKFNLPILDIYGEQDLYGVEAAVNARKVLMKRNNNSGYTKREIMGANHVFYGLEPMLVSTVRGWLYATFIKQDESDE